MKFWKHKIEKYSIKKRIKKKKTSRKKLSKKRIQNKDININISFDFKAHKKALEMKYQKNTADIKIPSQKRKPKRTKNIYSKNSVRLHSPIGRMSSAKKKINRRRLNFRRSFKKLKNENEEKCKTVNIINKGIESSGSDSEHNTSINLNLNDSTRISTKENEEKNKKVDNKNKEIMYNTVESNLNKDLKPNDNRSNKISPNVNEAKIVDSVCGKIENKISRPSFSVNSEYNFSFEPTSTSSIKENRQIVPKCNIETGLKAMTCDLNKISFNDPKNNNTLIVETQLNERAEFQKSNKKENNDKVALGVSNKTKCKPINATFKVQHCDDAFIHLKNATPVKSVSPNNSAFDDSKSKTCEDESKCRKCNMLKNGNKPGIGTSKTNLYSSPFIDADCTEMKQCLKSLSPENETPFREDITCKNCRNLDAKNIKLCSKNLSSANSTTLKMSLNESPFLNEKCSVLPKNETCQNKKPPKSGCASSFNSDCEVQNESAFVEDCQICSNKCNEKNSNNKRIALSKVFLNGYKKTKRYLKKSIRQSIRMLPCCHPPGYHLNMARPQILPSNAVGQDCNPMFRFKEGSLYRHDIGPNPIVMNGQVEWPMRSCCIRPCCDHPHQA